LPDAKLSAKLPMGCLRDVLEISFQESFRDLERAERIGELRSYPESRAFAELLIDCEEDRILRAVLVGTLREAS
jgi:hypothetical protein